MDFLSKLEAAVSRNKSLLCVGLDSERSKLPKEFLGKSDGQFQFNKRIIDATKDFVCAYKPNMAFYEAEGLTGFAALKDTLSYIPKNIPIILDAKRGDIGNTSRLYAQACYESLGVDAVTLHPYMGSDTVEPFLEFPGKGVFVLVKTSNPSAVEFEDIVTSQGEKLFITVAKKVSDWNSKYSGRVGAVIGATYPADLKIVRQTLGNAWILVPGVGSQGGDAAEVINAGLDSRGMGLIINSSREVLFASSGSDFAEKAGEKARALRDSFNKFRAQ